MEPEVPIIKQHQGDSLKYLESMIAGICKDCGKKVDEKHTSIKIYDSLQRKYRIITPLHLEQTLNEVIDGKHGVVAEMKFHFSTINLWLDAKYKELNISANQAKPISDKQGELSTDDYHVDVWKLFETEPNSMYCFPALYVTFSQKGIKDGNSLYQRGDNIEKKGLSEGLVIDCTCKTKGVTNKAFLNSQNMWQCPFCGKKWERYMFDSIPEDVDLLDAI